MLKKSVARQDETMNSPIIVYPFLGTAFGIW